MSRWSIDWPHVAPCPLIGGCANRHPRSPQRIRGRGTALQLCYLCHLNEHPSVKCLTLGQLEAKIMLLGLRHDPILRHRKRGCAALRSSIAFAAARLAAWMNPQPKAKLSHALTSWRKTAPGEGRHQDRPCIPPRGRQLRLGTYWRRKRPKSPLRRCRNRWSSRSTDNRVAGQRGVPRGPPVRPDRSRPCHL